LTKQHDNLLMSDRRTESIPWDRWIRFMAASGDSSTFVRAGRFY
jgi:hypothetical protein